MNTSSSPATSPASNIPVADDDLADQARPGHGVPSQDPGAGAQVALNPEEAEREGKSVLAGGGVLVGAVTGAAIGVVVAGPVGVLVGTTLGAVAGALGGAAAGSIVKPDNSVPAVPAVPAGSAPAQQPAPKR